MYSIGSLISSSASAREKIEKNLFISPRPVSITYREINQSAVSGQCLAHVLSFLSPLPMSLEMANGMDYISFITTVCSCRHPNLFF